MDSQPVPIAQASIYRVSWNPFRYDRWRVTVSIPTAEWIAYCRWRSEAEDLADKWIWEIRGE